MAEESDEVVEEVFGQLRIALAAAAQMAEKFARLREDLARQQQARTEQQNRELRVRFEAERDAARASVAPTGRNDWWESATVNDIADAYETAHAWEPVDPDLAASAEHMREEVRDRYGIDVDNLDADPAAVRAAMERTERERAQAAEARGESAEDLSAGVAFMDAADRADRDGERLDREQDARDTADTALGDVDPGVPTPDRLPDHERAAATVGGPGDGSAEHAEASANRDAGEVAYDSADRRGEFAADMERDGLDPEFIRGRLAADRNQATHPREALTTPPQRAKGRSATPTGSLQRERGGLSR
jgi:hypothetical protein